MLRDFVSVAAIFARIRGRRVAFVPNQSACRQMLLANSDLAKTSLRSRIQAVFVNLKRELAVGL
jgi:hypothetical protein